MAVEGQNGVGSSPDDLLRLTGQQNAVAAAAPRRGRPSAANSYFIGDSIADGLRSAAKAPGNTKAGRNPAAVSAAIGSIDPGELRGRTIYLSTGVSNNPRAGASAIRSQIDALRQKGVDPGDIRIIGVGDRSDFAGLNDSLAGVAKSSGAAFTGPLDPSNLRRNPNDSSDNGVHLKDWSKGLDAIGGAGAPAPGPGVPVKGRALRPRLPAGEQAGSLASPWLFPRRGGRSWPPSARRASRATAPTPSASTRRTSPRSTITRARPDGSPGGPTPAMSPTPPGATSSSRPPTTTRSASSASPTSRLKAKTSPPGTWPRRTTPARPKAGTCQPISMTRRCFQRSPRRCTRPGRACRAASRAAPGSASSARPSRATFSPRPRAGRGRMSRPSTPPTGRERRGAVRPGWRGRPLPRRSASADADAGFGDRLMAADLSQSLDPKTVEKEFADRLREARQQKMPFDIDMRESYFFAAPHRMRSVLSTTVPSKWKPQDSGELNQSFAFECCGDFPTVIQNTFMPEAGEWVVRKAPEGTPKQARDQAEQAAKEGTTTIFEAIGASNFYGEFGKSANPDLAIGTIAMWVDNGRPGRPRKCQTIPIRELEINLDGEGCVDDRFVVRWMRRRYVKRIFHNVELPKKVIGRPKESEDDRVAVAWGFWKVYDETEEECWLHAVTIEDEIVGQPTIIRGAGCCPLIVGRFNPGPEWAWGVGVMIQCLPEFRNLDEIASGKIRNLDQLLQPAIAWPDDSFASIESGLEAGMAYPVRPGTAQDIKNIYTPNPPDAAIYDRQDLEQRIKRLFFLDWPQQRGDTPPTATQWLDEMTMAQRRIGTPGLPFWQEFPASVFKRFEYLLESAGEIDPVTVPDGKGQPRRMNMTPYNPAQRAAEQQDVAQASRFVSIAAQAWPEEFKIAVDGTKSIMKFRSKMGVEDLIELRNQADVQNAIQQISQLQGGTPGQVPAAAQAGAPAPAVPGVAGPAPNQPQYQLRSKGF